MKKSDISITFAYPHSGENFKQPWVNSLIGMLLYELQKPKRGRHLGSILPQGGPYVDDNRTMLCIDHCNKTTDTHILMTDVDVEFQFDIMDRLANHIHKNPEAKIIAGRVNLLNGFPVFYKVDKKRLVNIHQPYPFKGLKEFDLVGTGIICIAREVFLDLLEKEGHQHFFHRLITGNNQRLGDDFSFCARVWKHGYKIYGAWDIEGIHWKLQPCRNRYPTEKEVEVHLK